MTEPEQPETRSRHTVFLNGVSMQGAGSSIGQGLRIIGYGFMAIAWSAIVCTSIVVTYLNGQS